MKFKTNIRKHSDTITLLKAFFILCFFLYSSSHLFSQNVINISGIVKDELGLPLIGVSIVIEGTTLGTITDLQGKFSIKVNDSSGDTLVVSYIGYKTRKILLDGKRVLNITLQEETKVIEEVVVIGYGSQKKETVTGSISSITNTELMKSPMSNISSMLAGKVSGLMAVQSSGEPGRNQSKLRVRGIGTLNAGDESNPLILVDGVERNTMDDLDPNEIETLNILKDASATAVFGVKGANGVIMVTTRSGHLGKPRVSLSMNTGLQNPINLPDLLNSYDYAVLKNEALTNDRKEKIFSELDLQKFSDGSDPIFYSSKNWIKEFVRPIAPQQQYNVNVSGGTSMVKYFVSFGYLSQDGLYDTGDLDVGFSYNPRYKRYNLRTNFDFDVTDNLKTSVRFGISSNVSNYPNASTNSLFYNFLSYSPFSSPGIVDNRVISGFINDPLGSYNIENRGNSPYNNLLSKGYQDIFGSKLNLNWSFDYKMNYLIPGLSAKAMIAYDNNYSHTSTWTKSVDLYSAAFLNSVDGDRVSFVQTSYDGNFGFSESFSKWRKLYFESSLNYNKSFDNHIITALALFNMSKEYSPSFAYNVPKSLIGFVGRITYSYMRKYLLEYNLGYNGSEQFPPGKRFGFFPAYSLGWVLSEEKFFPKNNFLTFLKFRGSYGEVGNDKTGGDRFLYLQSVFTYENGSNHGYWFGTEGVNYQKYTGSLEGRIGNPDVTWERAKKLNIGAEIKLINNKLSITGDYFQEKRDNILWELGTIPDLVAADLPKANIGIVKNHGYEVEMGWSSSVRDFDYWVKGNLSYARNEIVYKDEPAMPYLWMNETGFPVGQYKGYRTDGLYNYYEDLSNRPYYNFYGNQLQRGDLKYVDINGDGLVDQNDVVPVGYSENLPEIIYGISLGSSYKGFDVSVLFQGVANSSILLNEMAGWAFDWNWRSTLSSFKERWSEDRFNAGERISKVRLSSNGAESVNNLTSDYLIHDADYMRLKNIELGYSMRSSFLKKRGIELIRLYTNGSNLLTFTSLKDADPESVRKSGSYYPLVRVFNFGVNVQF